MDRYTAIDFACIATREEREAIQNAADEEGHDVADLRYVKKNGVKKIVNARTSETVRRLK